LAIYNNSYASAWLAQEKHSKIFLTFEDKNFTKLKPTKNEAFIHYHEIYLHSDMEYGLNNKQSLLFGFSLYKNIDYQYAYMQNGKQVIKQETHHYSFPMKFQEFRIGSKYHLFKFKKIISAASIQLLTKHHHSKSLLTEISFGKSGTIKKKNYFIAADFSKKFAITKDVDNYNFSLTLGLHKNKKNSYMIQFFNYYQNKYYDHISGRQISLTKPYHENKLSISKIKQIKPHIKLQQSIYNSLNNRSSLRVYGYTFSLWIDI
jgi:hypothetical protein